MAHATCVHHQAAAQAGWRDRRHRSGVHPFFFLLNLISVPPGAAVAYDETRRRKARRTGTRGYMDRGARDWAGNKRGAIVLGGAAMERVVAGRYEWRDRGMAPVSGARKRHWEDEHEPTHRAQRPRTDGAA